MKCINLSFIQQTSKFPGHTGQSISRITRVLKTMVCVFPLFGGFHRHFSPWILFCFIIIWVFLPIIHYSLLCWLFMIHNRLFIIPLTWLCYSLFLIFQTQIFIIHFSIHPVTHYSLSSLHSNSATIYSGREWPLWNVSSAAFKEC